MQQCQVKVSKNVYPCFDPNEWNILLSGGSNPRPFSHEPSALSLNYGLFKNVFLPFLKWKKSFVFKRPHPNCYAANLIKQKWSSGRRVQDELRGVWGRGAGRGGGVKSRKFSKPCKNDKKSRKYGTPFLQHYWNFVKKDPLQIILEKNLLKM